MSILPRILIIDDQYGAPMEGDNRARQAFCNLARLRDATADQNDGLSIPDPIAEAVFCRGQRISDGCVENDLDGTLRVIRKGWAAQPRWALVLLDLQFITGDVNGNGRAEGRPSDSDPQQYFGLKLLESISIAPDFKGLPVVMLSSMERSGVERLFSGHGALDFIDKEVFDRHNGRERMRDVLFTHGLIPDERIIGQSLSLLICLRKARRRARMGNSNILVLGETGTGKELLANYIHRKSGRAGAYVPCFTQGVPDTLSEDLIFGHEKGAFTGAANAQSGAAELAHTGTLFIDEFGELSPSVQSKLLRLLQEDTRETQRIGSNKVQKVDLLIILATNRMNLAQADGFRSDLLHRAHISNPLILPPLRERPDDIPLLAEYFIRLYETKMGLEKRVIPEETMALLTHFHWPGNVNQLKSIIVSAVSKYPRLRVLSPNHIELPEKTDALKLPNVPLPSNEKITGVAAVSVGLSDCCAIMEHIEFPLELQRRGEWTGQFPELRRAAARMSYRMLKAALEATADSKGDLKIHPAIKLLMGDTGLSASQAADEIKRILSQEASIREEIETDPVLSKAYAIALRLRPKGVRSKKT